MRQKQPEGRGIDVNKCPRVWVKSCTAWMRQELPQFGNTLFRTHPVLVLKKLCSPASRVKKCHSFLWGQKESDHIIKLSDQSFNDAIVGDSIFQG